MIKIPGMNNYLSTSIRDGLNEGDCIGDLASIETHDLPQACIGNLAFTIEV